MVANGARTTVVTKAARIHRIRMGRAKAAAVVAVVAAEVGAVAVVDRTRASEPA